MADEDTGTGAAETTEVTTPVDAPSTNLDTVIETELAKPEEGGEDAEDTKSDDATESDDGGEEDGSSQTGDTTGDKTDEDKDVDEETPQTPEPKEDKSAPELDSDITKPGEGKIAVKTFDGKTIYLNNLDELPEDFEPANYKEFAKATLELNAKAFKEANEQAEAEAKAEEDAQVARVQTIRDGWKSEVETLTKEGALPKDEKERAKIVDGVYDLMRKEGKQGRTYPSWRVAHEVFEARQAKAAQAEKQKQINETKKKQGGAVMSSGSNAAVGTSNVGLRPGMSIDDVIDNELAG